MKKITLNLVKGLLVIVLFTGVSVAISTTGVQTVNTANAGTGYAGSGSAGQASQVSSTSVNQYLVGHGYSSIQNLSIVSNTSWQAIVTNANGIQCRVSIFTQSTQIIGCNEVAI